MTKATQSFKTGMSFIGGANVPSYTLEFLTASSNHPPGSYETIVVPFIELGRSSTCAIRFSEEVKTVSRKHSALERRGNEVYIKNLSATNPTLVNGSPIANEWKLKNGDELQLSYEGPKLRFNSSASGASSLGVTKRVGLVVKQAVVPYRAALITMACLLILFSAGAAYSIYLLKKDTEQLTIQAEVIKKQNDAMKDSLALAIVANGELRASVVANKKKMEEELQATVSSFAAQQKELVTQLKEVKPEDALSNAINDLKGSVFYMGIKNIRGELDGELMFDEPYPENCHCTGFLLDDGRFVTARHCIEILFYEINAATLIASTGGMVTYEFYAYSSDESIRFDFTNHDFTIDRSTDYVVEEELDGQLFQIRQANLYDGTDWAYMETNQKGKIKAAPELSVNLSSGTDLHCLGFTYGDTYQELNNENDLDMLYSRASVAKDGIEKNTIWVSGYGFDNGNSGGPLLVIKNNEALAVAIVSAGFRNQATGRDDALGSVVPIRNIMP